MKATGIVRVAVPPAIVYDVLAASTRHTLFASVCPLEPMADEFGNVWLAVASPRYSVPSPAVVPFTSFAGG